ncbi:MAG: TonB family protein [Methylophilaceae bacterium]|jgi:TonB family protein
MNNFQKYGLLVAIIFSILLHLIVIEKISFEIFQSNIQEDFDNIQVTLVNPPTSREGANVSNKEKVLPKNSLAVDDTKIDIKNNIIVNNQEKNFKSINESIDTSKILSQIKDMDFSTKMQNLKKQQRIKSISANTTDYLYKLYFDAWRQKVEQIGAMNYPTAASELGMFGSLRLTVSLNSDGTIKNLFINKSSGHKELDQAALNIVKLGEPYARFPAEMLKNVDIINITRRWKFTEKNHFSK